MIKEQQKLPEGWVYKELGKAVDVILGQSPASSTYNVDGEGLPFFQGKTEFTELYPEVRKWCSSPKKIAQKDDVLVSVRAPVGPTNLAPSECAIGRGLAALRVSEEQDKKYYLYLVRRFQNELASLGTGTTFEAISGAVLKGFKVPVAPPEQQKQTVAKIEELFSHIDAAIESLKIAKEKLKQYRQSILKAAVTGELIGKLFDKKIIHPISKGIESLGQGWSPRCEKEPAVMSEWGVIKTTAVQPLLFLQDENKKLPSNLEPRAHLEILDGDLLITRAGPRVRVGVCSLVRNPRNNLMICDKVYRARVDCKIVMPEYFELVLNSPQIQDELEQLKTGINDSGVNLTQTKFLKLEMPFPLLEEQKEIVQRVEEKLTAADRLMTEIDTKLMQAQQQKQTILSSAFRGELL